MALPPCLFFDCPNFGGRGAPTGSTTVPLDREPVSSHRLSIQTTVVSGTIWPQFATQVLTGGCNLHTPSLEEGVVVWGRRWVP